MFLCSVERKRRPRCLRKFMTEITSGIDRLFTIPYVDNLSRLNSFTFLFLLPQRVDAIRKFPYFSSARKTQERIFKLSSLMSKSFIMQIFKIKIRYLFTHTFLVELVINPKLVSDFKNV